MVNNAWLVVTNVIIFFESAVSCVFYVKKKRIALGLMPQMNIHSRQTCRFF